MPSLSEMDGDDWECVNLMNDAWLQPMHNGAVIPPRKPKEPT